MSTSTHRLRPGRELRVVSPAPRRAWKDVLAQDESALVFQTPEWLDAVCRVAGWEDASRFYETPGGKALVLPLVRRRGVGRPSQDASLPYNWGSAGLLAQGGLEAEDIGLVLDDLRMHGAASILVRPNSLLTGLWAEAAQQADIVRVAARSHVLDLEGGFEHVWTTRFTGSTRRNVRSAEKAESGLTVEMDTTGRLVSVFYDIYLRWLGNRAERRHLPLWLALRLGRRRTPLRQLQVVAEALGDSCRVWVASLHGYPVAAAVSLVHGRNAVYWRGASDRASFGSARPNDLLQKLMIEDACRSGCRHYYMGESGGVASLERFKAGFGAIQHQHDEYYLERLAPVRAYRRARVGAHQS
jgi:hypothetical protein